MIATLRCECDHEEHRIEAPVEQIIECGAMHRYISHADEPWTNRTVIAYATLSTERGNDIAAVTGDGRFYCLACHPVT